MPKEECPYCNGNGKIGGHITEDGEDQECEYCGGTGVVWVEENEKDDNEDKN